MGVSDLEQYLRKQKQQTSAGSHGGLRFGKLLLKCRNVMNDGEIFSQWRADGQYHRCRMVALAILQPRFRPSRIPKYDHGCLAQSLRFHQYDHRPTLWIAETEAATEVCVCHNQKIILPTNCLPLWPPCPPICPIRPSLFGLFVHKETIFDS